MAPQIALIALALLACPFFCKTHAIEVPRTTHPCQRPCEEGKPPITCRYEFVLEFYASMGTKCGNCPFNRDDCFKPGCVPAEGQKKALYLINRLLPGPSIEVCKGDRIIVDLKNELPTETTSVHWHGMHQSMSPFMDGVPFITQCPISPGNMFRYDFVADTIGTLLWHSHSNEQRADGIFGSLIVRVPSTEDKHQHLYDQDEHVIILNDWDRILDTEAFIIDKITGVLVWPHTILVNGLGRYKPLKNDEGIEKHMPTAVFEVEQGKRHRFRIINAGVQDCPMEMSIDNHTMHVISTDGNDIIPVEVDSLRILSGERYDVIVAANQEIDNFWMRFRSKDGTNIPCEITRCHQASVLRYKGASNTEPSSEVGFDIPSTKNMRQLNPYNKGTETPGALSIPALYSLEKSDKTSKKEPDHKFYISYNYLSLNLNTSTVHPRNDDEVPNLAVRKTLWQLNHINFKTPSVPILTQWENLKPNEVCNSSTVSNCLQQYCQCTHVLNVKLDSVVELVLVDEGTLPFNHPIHLHGYSFRVLAMQKVNTTTTLEEVKAMDREGKIHRKPNFAPIKDTVIVPSGGFTIIRFHATNPGYWLMHCHFEHHANVGMALLFKVGEHSDFPKAPANFPKCNLYKPDEED